ncbi:MAG TPA: S8 family serine peptidase, partial [Solirubrobacterales bacterium]|nr:S8 family serine peptidase [Solirubrobacterales bacterium]
DGLSLVCAQAVGEASAYALLEGTSMAAPHVSGAAALLFSLRPAASVTEVRDALLESVDPVPSLDGLTVTGGRLDAAAAMESLEPTPPPAPLLAATDPASPANDNEPRILGSAAAGTTVDVYSGASCAGAPVASGSAAGLEAPGIAVAVADNSTTEFSATATSAAAATSACSAPISYTELTPTDGTAPAAPVLTATSPPSPSAVTTPRLVGIAEPGSIVEIFSAAGCVGSPITSGTAAELEAPGILVLVAAGSTITFSATATDAADNVSPCSAPIAYTNNVSPGGGGGGFVTTIIPPPPPELPPAVISTPPPPTCTVPKLTKKTLGQAKTALAGANCKLGRVTKPKARKGKRLPALVVRSSSPAAGTASSGPVNLTLGPKPKKQRH